MFANKHGKFAVLALLLMVAMLVVACAPNTSAQAVEPAAGITVVGHGEATGTPDQANVQVGVETFAETVDAATTQNQATIDAIMAALEAQGIAREDIQTSNYSLWAEQFYGERGPEGIVGYHVSNQVNVTIRDIGKVGDVLAAVIGAGANNIFGVNFSVADPAALEAEAREKAMADARARAEELARLSNVELGEVRVISEVIQTPPPIFGAGGGGFDMEQGAAAPSVTPGQLNFQVQIQVTFGIQ
ncbi:MAG: SIMPL domain-containing protein [Chloroflexi bacterium]|nr:SIMPL domain-containing protein [Chloroflexota bacterium]MCI0646899.1 SIMPL domain-containing protein [Chloroflexota bacterium]MCI0729096.1 SIMPL domain-containing protein [Chloroflexota bacterium]